MPKYSFVLIDVKCLGKVLRMLLECCNFAVELGKSPTLKHKH